MAVSAEGAVALRSAYSACRSRRIWLRCALTMPGIRSGSTTIPMPSTKKQAQADPDKRKDNAKDQQHQQRRTRAALAKIAAVDAEAAAENQQDIGQQRRFSIIADMLFDQHLFLCIKARFYFIGVRVDASSRR